MARLNRIIFAACLVLGIAAPGRTDPTPLTDADEEKLRLAKVGTDDTSLMEFLRSRCRDSVDRVEVERLIERLRSDSFPEREKAEQALGEMESLALPALRKAVEHEDAEVRVRARTCLERTERRIRERLPLAAVRLLVKREPAGVVETLIRCLPYTRDAAVEKEIWFGLDQLARKKGRIDPALMIALTDERPARRALAACVVGARGNAEERKAATALLDDPDAGVRLRAAQGLLAARHKEGIPTLIRLLEDPVIENCWQAEELLCWAAWTKAPGDVVGAGTAESKRKACAAWRVWWQARGPALDLAKDAADFRRPGLLLVEGGNGGGPCLYGCDNRVRWELPDMPPSGHTELLPGGRTWRAGLGTYGPNSPAWEKQLQIVERDVDGRVMWEYKWSGSDEEAKAELFRRLPNGNTLLVVTSGPDVTALEVGRDKKERIRWTSNLGQDAVRRNWTLLPSGNLLGWPWEFDLATGTRTKRFGFLDKYESALLPHPGFIAEVLPEGRLLICHAKGAAEVDFRGEVLWVHETLGGVAWAKRLDNGDRLLLPYIENTSASARVSDFSVRVDASGRPLKDWLDRAKVGRQDQDCYVYVQVDPSGRHVGELITRGWMVSEVLGLVRMGFDGPQAEWKLDSVATRIRQLRHPDASVRVHAARCLHAMGPAAEPAVPLLVDILGDDHCRTAASDALVAIGPGARPMLVRALGDRRAIVRAEAVACLGWGHKTADAEKVLPPLIRALGDEDAGVRRRTAWALRCYGPRAEAALPALVQQLRDSDAEAASDAAGALAELKEKGALAVPALCDALKDKREKVAVSAAFALANLFHVEGIRAKSATALPALVEAAKRPEAGIRNHVLFAMSWLGPEAAPAVDFVIAALQKDEYPSCRRSSASALAGMGPTVAAKTVPVLVKGLRTKAFGEDRVAMASALGSMGVHARSAIPALAEALHPADWTLQKEDWDKTEEPTWPAVMEAAARALGKMGPEAKGAIPALIAAIRPPKQVAYCAARPLERARTAAAWALGRIGPDAAAALPVLKEASEEKHWMDEENYIRTASGDGLAEVKATKWLTFDRHFQPAVEEAMQRIRGK